MRHIAIIPARGGSKRIPSKNILDFMGKPMIVWTIEAALDSGKFDRVLVSTDSEEIAGVAKAHGASAPFLREAHADDLAPVSAATLAALGQVESQLGERYDCVTQLMANCPLRTADDIVDALNNFEQKRAPSQISCFKYGWMNPWWAVKLDGNGTPEKLFPEGYGTVRSQDLPELYCPTGAIWIAQADALKKHGSFYLPDHRYHPLSWQSALDIDDADDLQLAETVFSMRQKNH